MAKILTYNFNENDSTNVRDYSTNDLHATGYNLTTEASATFGTSILLNGSTSYTELTDFTGLSNLTDFCFYMKFEPVTNILTNYVLSIAGLFEITWNGATLTATVTKTDASYSVTNNITAMSNGNYYDIFIEGSNLNTVGTISMLVDGTKQTKATTGAGLTENVTDTFYLGRNAAGGYGNLRFDEIQIFSNTLTSIQKTAITSEQKGLTVSTITSQDFTVGSIIGSGYDEATDSQFFGIISYVGGAQSYKVYPLQGNLRGGLMFQRVGHNWDSSLQWFFEINDTPEICFYDNITKVNEFKASNKKVYCIGKEGPITGSTTVTTTYTVLSSDKRIYVDSSGGAFTITLPSSPTTDYEVEIIDKAGSCQTKKVTVDGNGNNIIGNPTIKIDRNYMALVLVFNGTSWNLK